MGDGVTGELVFSTLTRRDSADPLPHQGFDQPGPQHLRMRAATARIARFKEAEPTDMLIIRSVNVFRPKIESALLEMGGTTPHYLMIVDRVNNLDTLEVHVEVEERFFSGSGRWKI